MCYCDDWEFSIDRADEFMVSKKNSGKWFVISPPDLWELIEISLRQGIIKTVDPKDEIFITVGYEA